MRLLGRWRGFIGSHVMGVRRGLFLILWDSVMVVAVSRVLRVGPAEMGCCPAEMVIVEGGDRGAGGRE